jgi:hypothetical protein
MRRPDLGLIVALLVMSSALAILLIMGESFRSAVAPLAAN